MKSSPAAFTRMSILPSVPRTSATPPSMEPGSVRSMYNGLPPKAAATSPAASLLTSARITRAPYSARSRAVAAPRPLPAPVTRATWSERSNIMMLSGMKVLLLPRASSGRLGDAWRPRRDLREGGGGETGDVLPGVVLLYPAPGGATHVVAQVLVGEQAQEAAGEGLGILGGDEVPGFAVGDARFYAADPGADDRLGAGHRLQRRHPERLVVRHCDRDVTGAVVAAELFLRPAPGERHPLPDPEPLGEGREPAFLGRDLYSAGLAAHDHELRVEVIRQKSEGLDEGVHALAGYEPADVYDRRFVGQAQFLAGFAPIDGPEFPCVHAARHERETGGLGAVEARKLLDLGRAGGEDAVGLFQYPELRRSPFGRRGVGGALLAFLDLP